MNRLYKSLQKVPIINKSYVLKFLFVAFIGIHVPLLGIVTYVVINKNDNFSESTIIVLTLIFTLLATFCTLIALKKLLNPLLSSKLALVNFLDTQELPNLPIGYKDEAGVLMNLIQKSLNNLDILSKEKQQITALVSHNLRTPLNQIKGMCELIKVDEENQEVYVENINKIADTQLNGLTSLLNQLVSNEFHTKVIKQDFDLVDLVKEEAEKMAFEFEHKTLEFSFSNDNEKVIINSDRNKIALVLHNLFSNAAKFSYPKSTITAEIKKINNKVLLSVKDKGMGFSKDYRDMLFKDSRNIGRPGTKDEPSVGLGLHLCKRTIQEIGGDLLAESEGDNKGATFTIVI